ncbi:hypothetical protein MTR_6g022200 [Medicago truncatula]|uniref:Uncharacterized protein n=1 Tax=Medicago truncatula TaxID=3880 RepID=A0A072U6N0_MEDTR|nr:hypothetical protein MTR_6g022200 [Medicago truncatula]
MERYYKRTSESQEVNEVETTPTPTHEQPGPSFKNGFLEVDLENLPANPRERKQLSCYHPNERDEIRRAYLAKGPCQPKEHNFPQRPFGTFLRKGDEFLNGCLVTYESDIFDSVENEKILQCFQNMTSR